MGVEGEDWGERRERATSELKGGVGTDGAARRQASSFTKVI